MNIMMLDGMFYIEEYVGEVKFVDWKRLKEGFECLKRNGYYGYSFESWICYFWCEWG